MIKLVRNEPEFSGFVENIRENGIAESVFVVKKGKQYELRCGFRRWCAAKELEMAHIPARILPDSMSDREIAKLMRIFEGKLQKQWSEYNTWAHLRSLHEMGEDIEQLANENNTTVKNIHSRFAALDICQEYLDMFPDDQPPWSNIYETLKVGSNKKKSETMAVLLEADREFKVAVFKQLHSGEIRDPKKARSLSKIILDTGLRQMFLQDGFQATTIHLKSKATDGERLIELGKELNGSIGKRIDEYANMNAVRAELPERISKVKKHKNGPLTEEERALVEKWYAYAMAVAYDNARRPYDDDDVRTVAHDALIGAARYYQEGRGCTTFKSFYKHCLLPQLARAFHKRLSRLMLPIPDGMETPCTDEVPSFENHEFVNYLQQGISANQREVLHQVYEMGMSHRQIASMRGCEHQNVTHLHRLALHSMRKRADWSYIQPYQAKVKS